MNEQYEDILYLPHHVSSTRPQMPMSDRAAQFSPFAALTGYDAAIKETGRLTDARTELTEDELNALDMKCQKLMAHLDKAPLVHFTYFQPDVHKEGGAYVTVSGTVKKIDIFERMVYLKDGTSVPLNDVFDIPIDESSL